MHQKGAVGPKAPPGAKLPFLLAMVDNLRMVDVDELVELWREACSDAGYKPEVEALLYLVPGSSDQGALHLEPGSEYVADPQWPLSRDQRNHINSFDHRNLHRVLVREPPTPRVALGYLRHELQHAQQYDYSVSVYRFRCPLRPSGGGFGKQNLPSMVGSASLYNVLPHEVDANRASGRLTFERFGEPTEEEAKASSGVLFRDKASPDTETLSFRLLAHSSLFPSAFVEYAELSKTSIEELLGLLGTEAQDAWVRLVENPEIAEAGTRALAAAPNNPEANRELLPADWESARSLMLSGQKLAERDLSIHGFVGS